jgi:PAS domain S-box-containing protein
MSNPSPSIINIALVGGGDLCTEILEKTTFNYAQEGVNAPIVAVAEPDPDSPGIRIAQKLGLLTFTDYRDLYDGCHDIHLIIVLTSEAAVFEDIIKTRPPSIRIMSYPVFEIFWKAIGQEERKLRERTHEMETILNGLQDFISVITPEKVIVDVNESFLRWMGLKREEVIGKKCYEVFQHVKNPCSEERILCPLNEVVRTKRHTMQVMTRPESDGERRYFEINVYPIWGKEGQITKFIEISRDITERKREEEEITRRLEEMVDEKTRQLQETHAQLMHQDKMASLGKLSASVVHEINNPIAGILNLILLMKRIMSEERIDQKELDRFKRYLDLMETETKRTSRIVSNLLAFSRHSKMPTRPLDLHNLLEKTLFINSNLLKISNVKVDRRLAPSLPEIIGSEDQLQQVFMNIISNAGEAMEAKGGTLTITTEHVRKDQKIIVSFEDTGLGIPPDNMQKLFEPFFTTKKEGKGVGLGLSVAYGIVQEHGGNILVQSRMGEGTVFKVEVPLKPPSPAMAQNGGLHGKY